MSKLSRPKRTLIEALEPRLLFSATADIAVFDDNNSDILQLSHAAAALDLTTVYNLSPEPSGDDELALFPLAEPAVSNITAAVFVDRAVENHALLVEDILQQYPNGGIEIIYLNAETDGITQISEKLGQFSQLDSLHIISHGTPGSVTLGNAQLNANTLFNYEAELTAWRAALGENADILIYGCDVAATLEGKQLIAQIAALTDADVAASDDVTGHRSLQGDWELEYAVGEIEHGVLVSSQTQAAWIGALSAQFYLNIQDGSSSQSLSSINSVGQSFSYSAGASPDKINQISVQLKKDVDAAHQSITVQLLSGDWSGAVLASKTINFESLGAEFAWRTVNLDSAITMVDGQSYVVRLLSSGSDGKVAAAYSASNIWNNSDLILNGATNTNADLKIVVGYHDGVNQPTVITAPVSASTNQETALVFNAANGNRLSIADSDAFPNEVEVTLSAQNGRITLGQTSGVQFTSNYTGVNEFYMTFRGTVDAINAVLASATYEPVSYFEGTDTLKITATDLGVNGEPVSKDIVITVNDVNDAPVVANPLSDLSTDEGSMFSFVIPLDTFTDVDGDTLTYTAFLADGGNLPAWLNFNPSTRTLSGEPDDADVGKITIRITATDSGGLNVNDTFELTINNVNDAPVLHKPITDKSVFQDANFSFTFDGDTFHDDDLGEVFSYTADLQNGSALPVWLSFDSDSRTFSGTPSAGDVGTITIRLTVTDSGGATASDVFDIVVSNVNDAPAGTNKTITLNEDSSHTFSTADFGFSDSNDLPANNLFAVVIASLPTAGSLTLDGAAVTANQSISVADITSGKLVFTPAANANGLAYSNFTFQVQDDGGTANGGVDVDPTANTITFDVTATNDAPAVANTIGNQNATEDLPFTFQFNEDVFADVDVGDTLTYSATLSGGTALPSWLSFDPATRTFSGTPTNSDVGAISITVTASDGNGGTITDTFDLVVANTNDAPTVANPIADQNATQDSPFSFQFDEDVFADVDVGDVLTYTATLSGGAALPSWLNFDTATRTFSGTPTNADVGTLTIFITANDGNGGTITDTFDLIIANTNDAPTVANPIDNQNATEDLPFTFQFDEDVFADIDVGDTLTYSATLSGGTALPSWLAFNAGTRTFSGTPTNADVGILTIFITANDGNGGTITDTFDLVIANTNDAPTVVNPMDNQNATEDLPFAFQFDEDVFADVDVGDVLTYSATLSGGVALPGWLSFDPATRTFSGTPSNADVGTLTIVVTASDGNGGTITDTFDLVIANTNDAPTVVNPIGNQNATENLPFTFQFDEDVFADVDVGDVLTYSATLSGGVALPGWLSFDPATRTFSGTPTNADVGTISITVTASDGNGGTITDTFDLVVANTNDAPTVANPIADQNATQDSPFTFQFDEDVFADVDVGDVLIYTATLSGGTALPGWLSFDPATRTFSGTPINSDVGTISIVITADDGNGGTITDTFDLVVANTNDAPTVANPIADQSATEDLLFTFQFDEDVFADVDVGDVLTYTATLSGGAALPGWLGFDVATRTFSGTPTNSDVGTLTITVTADDGKGGTVTDTFDLVVVNTNDAPTVANPIDNQNATENLPFSFQFDEDVFADVDVSDVLTYTATLSGGAALPGWLGFDVATRTFSGTPSNADVGTISITVTASDGNSGTITDTFDLVVANINDAPTVANPIENQNATEDLPFTFQFDEDVFADVDVGDVLTYSATLSGGTALPSWLSFDAATRTFSGTPTNSDVGTLTIIVTADDGKGGTVTDTFDLVIANTNDAPTVANPIDNQNATENLPFSFQFDEDVFADVDVGDVLTYTATLSGGAALPSWLNFDTATRTFSGTPTNSDVGTISIVVTASDGNGGIITDTFDLVIANTNDAPTVANPIDNQNVTEDLPFTFQFDENVFFDADVGDVLTYTATLSGGAVLPNWLSFDPATRTFSGTPSNADVGTISIVVTANDGNGGTITDTFDLVIANTNDAPTVVNPIGNQNATEDLPFTFQFNEDVFADVDVDDTLTYSATLSGGTALPSWLSFDPATRTFSGAPTSSDVGTISITVTASDGNGGTITDTFDLIVANTNDAPTVANPIADQNATQDSPFSFQFDEDVFADVDVGDVLTYTATLSGGMVLPSWLSFDAATRTFSGIPTNADIGTLTIVVTANDGNGGTITDTFDLVIANTNDAPTVVNPMDNQNATEDLSFAFQFDEDVFADIDVGDALTYSATLSGGAVLPNWLSFDPATRTFSGTPSNADVGTISIVVTANDGNGGTITDTFDLVVANINDAPTVANPIADQNATQDSPFSFQFDEDIFADVDVGDVLTYTATLSGGAALPGWLGFDVATRTFSGTPTNSDVGTLTITVTADDGKGGTVTDTFDLVVVNTNDAPTVANPIDNQNATENLPFSFQFDEDVFADVDVGDVLTYSATLSGEVALPGWLSFDPATRTFSGTPSNADVGTLTIVVTASDGNGGTITDTFDLVIANTNDAPTVVNPIANQNATEDLPFAFQFDEDVFADIDVGDALTYSATLSGGAVLPNWLSFDPATRTFSGTPSNAYVGTISIVVTANDGNGGTITDTFDLVVANINDAPTVVNPIDNQNATQDSPFTFQFDEDVFADVDVGDVLTYTATLSGGAALPGWLSFDPATRTFSGTPTNADIGTLTIVVTANDGNGGTITDTFDLAIANTNDAPTVANPIANQNATEDLPFTFQFDEDVFADIDMGDTLTYSATLSGGTALPSWLSFDTATRTFSGMPTNADIGTLTIVVTANDGNGGAITDTFDLIIDNTNDAPTVTNPIDNQNATEDSPFTFQFDEDVFADVDVGDVLTYSATLLGGTVLPSWLSFDPATRTFSGTPTNSDVGTISITVTASDGNGGMVTEQFLIVVKEQQAPAPIVIPPVIEEPTPPVKPEPTLPPVIAPPLIAPPDQEQPNPTPPTKGEDASSLPVVPAEPEAPDFISDRGLFIDDGMEDAGYNNQNDKSAQDYARAEDARKMSELSVLSLTTSTSLVSLITPDAGFTPWEVAEFDSEVRRIRAQMDEAFEEENNRKAVIAGLGLSLTTGLLIWSLRASSLLLALMSMLPLWRGLDPLPILDEVNKRKKELEQQRKDRKREDKNAKEVGYLFDHAQEKNKKS